MTHIEDLERLRKQHEAPFCEARFGDLDVCTEPRGHDGNHVGADATWPNNRLARAWILARDAHKQLDAHNAEMKKREKPDPDAEAFRLAKSDEEE